MKSERRHELQHNELAAWLANALQTIKPYQNIISAAVLLVVIGAVSYTVWSRIASAQAAQAWDELGTAVNSYNLEKLAQVTEKYPHTTVGHMAAVVLADIELGNGCSQLFVNKVQGQHSLAKAVDLYQSVRDEGRVPALLERATFGLARAKESQGDEEHLKQAQQLYKEVVAKWPQGAFAVAASQRLADLGRPGTKALYDQLAKFEPKPPAASESSERPTFDLNSLPSEPTADMPDIMPGMKSGSSKPKMPLLKTEAAPSAETGKAKDEPKAAAEKKTPEKTGK